MEKIIDQLGNLIRHWFVYRIDLEKPLVINLLGMTGTGKTDLVKNLVNKLAINMVYLDARSIAEILLEKKVIQEEDFNNLSILKIATKTNFWFKAII